MKLSDKLALLEEQEARAARRDRQAELEAAQRNIAQRLQRFRTAFDEWTDSEILAIDPATGGFSFEDYDDDTAGQFVARLETVLNELAREFETPDGTSSQNGTGNKPQPDRVRPRQPRRERSSASGRPVTPRRATPATDASKAEPAEVTTVLHTGDKTDAGSHPQGHKSGGSFTSAVPHFAWICAALGALVGFIVASTTRGMLHYNGTAGKVVPVLWVILITAFMAWMCWVIGEALNRESDD